MSYSPPNPSKRSACLKVDEVPKNQLLEKEREYYLDCRKGEQNVYFLNIALRELASALS